ncbi:GNAT family N-acetyltransferase [Paraburkholderia sp. DD10]|uniref:GNAT family N-acetyltransferase n=1 Tax=Paraburkholderia sp. DD10 TaxID=3409691 RepID=UPI003B9DF32A
MVNEDVSVTLMPAPRIEFDRMRTDVSNARTAVIHAARAGLNERSIFHEPWWLDIATGGNWKLASVHDRGQLIAEMPYTVTRKGIWRLSTLPALTRTLGPVIPAAKSTSDDDWRHCFGATQALVEQLPECALFHQRFDPHVSDAVGFALLGFGVAVSYTMRIEPGRAEPEVWAGLRPNTRNLIRRAGEQHTVRQITDANLFVSFYDANLTRRSRDNVYGTHVMRQLVDAFVSRGSGMVLGTYQADGSLCSAIAVIWDKHTMYYLLSSRKDDAHGGVIGLLLWNAMRNAREKNLTFDFDGISNVGILKFLSGFGGTLVPRLEVTRASADYAAMRGIVHLGRSVSRSVRQRVTRLKRGG